MSVMKTYYVYILANHKCGTLYVGVTNDLIRRVQEHKSGIIQGFTKRYRIDQLVYFEDTPEVDIAITREKQLKKWSRAWKIELIEQNNPQWLDLYPDLVAEKNF
jgi:putative endonuclease